MDRAALLAAGVTRREIDLRLAREAQLRKVFDLNPSQSLLEDTFLRVCRRHRIPAPRRWCAGSAGGRTSSGGTPG